MFSKNIHHLSILLLFAAPLQTEEKEWVWLNGKLTQIDPDKTQTTTDLDQTIEWKMINGKLTKIEKQTANSNQQKRPQLAVEIPNTESEGLKTIDLKRQKDITQSFSSPEINSPLVEEQHKSLQQKLSLEDQKIILPKRIIRNPYSDLSPTELNKWGKELVQTKTWLNYHHKRLKDQKTPEQEFINYYQKVLENWQKDVAGYQKAVERTKKD